MPDFDFNSAPDIPTLTIRSSEDSLPPVLTDIVGEGEEPAPHAFRAAMPSEAVLRALLHAEIDRMTQDALDEALERIRTRVNARLPEIIARVLRTTRPG